QIRGLSTDLPGGNLGDLPSSLPRSSSLPMTPHDANGSGAMLKVLKDPSLLAAAPGTPARAAMMDAPQPLVRGTRMPGTASPGTGDPGESLGLPIRSPVPERSSPSLLESSGPSGDLRAEPSAAPRALI